MTRFERDKFRGKPIDINTMLKRRDTCIRYMFTENTVHIAWKKSNVIANFIHIDYNRTL